MFIKIIKSLSVFPVKKFTETIAAFRERCKKSLTVKQYYDIVVKRDEI